MAYEQTEPNSNTPGRRGRRILMIDLLFDEVLAFYILAFFVTFLSFWIWGVGGMGL